MIESTSNRRRAEFTVSHYDREAVDVECQATSRRIPTTQPEVSQEVRTSMGTAMPSTTSSIRTTSSSRPNMTTMSATPFTSAMGRAPPAETIRADGGGLMYNTTTLEVQDVDIAAPEGDIYHGVYPDFQLPLPNRPHLSDLLQGILNWYQTQTLL